MFDNTTGTLIIETFKHLTKRNNNKISSKHQPPTASNAIEMVVNERGGRTTRAWHL